MATRLYFDSVTSGAVSPTPDSGWEDSSSILVKILNNTKGSSANADCSAKTSTAGQDRLHQQHVSFPMDSGISFNGTTVKLQIMAKESATNDNATSRMGARIVSRDGLTVRQTLFAVANYGPTTEFLNTGNRNKTFADGDIVTGTYTTVDGDRLVIEIGHSDASGISISCTTNYGETGTDLPVDETTTTGAPWVEFSNTITFQAEAVPATIPQTNLLLMGVG